VHIGQPTRAIGFLLAALPVGTVLADALVARLLPARLQRLIMLPAALLIFVPMTLFAASPRLPVAIALLVICGLGSSWAAGIDGLILEATPPDLRRRTLAVMGAGLMFVQGAGFALWGTVGQFVPVTVVIPVAAGVGVVLAFILRPNRATRSRPPGAAEDAVPVIQAKLPTRL
jgi:MFS family permease